MREILHFDLPDRFHPQFREVDAFDLLMFSSASTAGPPMATDHEIDWNDAYYGGRNLLPPDILIRKTAKSPKSTALLAEITKATN
jgi:hypothetical protein